MLLDRHKKAVIRLEAEAIAESLKATRHREAVDTWKHETLGKPATLVWIFAVGALLGVSRKPVTKGVAAGTSAAKGAMASTRAIGMLNAAGVAWRLFGHPIVSAATRGAQANGADKPQTRNDTAQSETMSSNSQAASADEPSA